MNRERLITRAEEELTTHPYDEVHNLLHHRAVWENCLQIIENEKLQNVDLDALQVAAMWHDVQRGQTDELDILRAALAESGATAEETEKVLAITGNHTFGSEQELLEAKVLFDADKLEYVNPGRAKVLLDGYRAGSVTAVVIKEYADLWKERIDEVPDKLHFRYSKDTFAKRLEAFIAFAKQHPELQGFIR